MIGRPALPVALPAALASAILLAACQDPLGSIDRNTDRLVEMRSQLLGDQTLRPTVADRPSDIRLPGSIDDKAPATVNPNIEALVASPTARDVSDRKIADRLQAYADQALGEGADPDGLEPPEAMALSLSGSFRRSQETGREFLTAEEDYIFSAIALLQTRHLFSPRFFNDTRAALSGFGRDGRFQHANDIVNTLRATQRLPDGGSLTAQWIVQATDQLREQASGGYVQSSRLALSGEIPLLRGAGPTAREDLIQSERNLVYQARTFERTRRELLVSIANDYFALLELRANIANQRRQLDGLRLLEQSTTARVEAGRLRPFQQQLAANQVLSGEASLAGLRERYILELDRFKVRLGIDTETPLVISDPDLALPQPAVSQAEAVQAALTYRLDLQNERDQLDDTRRAVRNARNNTLPDLRVDGNVNVPTPAGDPTGGLDPDAEELDYAAGVTLSLPLDRVIERLELREQLVRLERAVREYQRFRDGVIVEARQAVRVLDLSRFQLQLADRAVEINELRLEDLRLRDDTDPQSVVDAENELLNALNNRASALTDLRSNVLTYLLTTGQLRVQNNGELLPPPGLDAAEEPSAASPAGVPAVVDDADDVLRDAAQPIAPAGDAAGQVAPADTEPASPPVPMP